MKDRYAPFNEKVDIRKARQVETMEKSNRKYYTINEKTAYDANMVNPFHEYKTDSATETYKYYCDKVYDILDRIKEQKPQNAL